MRISMPHSVFRHPPEPMSTNERVRSQITTLGVGVLCLIRREKQGNNPVASSTTWQQHTDRATSTRNQDAAVSLDNWTTGHTGMTGNNNRPQQADKMTSERPPDRQTARASDQLMHGTWEQKVAYKSCTDATGNSNKRASNTLIKGNIQQTSQQAVHQATVQVSTFNQPTRSTAQRRLT